MYTFLIRLYTLVVYLITPYHRKARLLYEGQHRTVGILWSNIKSREHYIWIHAASLGEFEQGRPMIEKIRARYPQYKILLTFFSPSGYEVRKDYPGADVICYLPFDTPRRVRQFIGLAQPVAAIFIKYEFWGNYLSELKRQQIPTFIISSIFRREQLFFQWFGAPYRKMLFDFTHIYVQDEGSKNLLVEYGIQNVTVAGDTRFDRVQDIRNAAKELPLVDQFTKNEAGEKQLTLVAGSSWPQDEAFLIPYFNQHPEMKLIIAPHEIHATHLEAIQSSLKRPFICLSQVKSAEDLRGKDCLIVDCFGLLSSIYRYGEVAYVGGGFGAGIHNTLEAAVYGVPVLFGPKYHKFKEAKDLIVAGGGFSVKNGKAFQAKMDELIASRDLLRQSGKASGDFVHARTGATDRILPQMMDVIQHSDKI